MSTSQLIQPPQITAQVSRILKTDPFRSSRILSDFLKYVVKETLDGNEQSLKEYVIATEVLKKSPDFNPQLDAVVRIHARRLRQFLTDYYAGVGREDPVKISVPKGRYIPVFAVNVPEVPRSLPKAEETKLVLDKIPTLAVMPFACLQDLKRGRVICSVLSRDITVGLSYFDGMKVVSFQSTENTRKKMKNWDEIVSSLGADYIISGACMRDSGNLKVSVELHHVPENQIIWAETLVVEDFEQDELKGYEKVVKKVVAKACGYFGIIFRTQLSYKIPQDYSTLYAIYWHNRYHQDFSYESYQEASAAIDKGLSINPRNPMLLAFKAELLLNLCIMDMPDDDEYFRQGSTLVSQAISLDPNNQHAWQVYGWSALLGSNKNEYNKAADKCYSINRFNPMYMGAIGFAHQCVERCEEGLGMMLESIDLNPHYHWVINLGLCLYHIQAGKYEDAVYWARLINRPGLIWDPLLRLSAMGLSGKKEGISGVKNELLEFSPDFSERARVIVGRFLIYPALEDRILLGLSQAGMDIQS